MRFGDGHAKAKMHVAAFPPVPSGLSIASCLSPSHLFSLYVDAAVTTYAEAEALHALNYRCPPGYRSPPWMESFRSPSAHKVRLVVQPSPTTTTLISGTSS
jgi:hypothetical protein